MSQAITGNPTPRIGRLDSARDVRKEASRLYRAGRRGDLSASDCSKLASVLGLILRSIEVNELEERVTRLEENS